MFKGYLVYSDDPMGWVSRKYYESIKDAMQEGENLLLSGFTDRIVIRKPEEDDDIPED